MKMFYLTPAEGALQKSKRIGRGQGSGKGGTSTKGHKGDQSRSGHKDKAGFEGGQMPLHRRLPKFGFVNPFRIEYDIINVDELVEISDKHKVSEIDINFLKSIKKLKGNKILLKILGDGEIKKSLTIKAHKFSQSAQSAIESAGGKAITIEG